MAGMMLSPWLSTGTRSLSMGRPERPGQEGHEPQWPKRQRRTGDGEILGCARSRIHAAGKNVAGDGFENFDRP
jgi:hypothetical protein